MKLVDAAGRYRKDIDGLRAIAVLAVIAFHFGIFPGGYLGVDVFFVISGYLITDMIAREARDGRFSLSGFYLRRIRRILPLSLFVVLVSLVVGSLTMLPDDLENLAQSAVATNLFANNVLQAITTKNYWDVVNEYKPLMHTWSLGIEEQYYLLYPLLFLFAQGNRIRRVLPLLCLLTIASLSFSFYGGFGDHWNFYLVFFRFWELALGGIAALVLKGRLVRHGYAAPVILVLGASLVTGIPIAPQPVILLIVVGLSVAVVASSNRQDPLASSVLQNPVFVGIGKISFSLYMWHQVVMAFSRYFWVQHPGPLQLAVLVALTFALSVSSYFLIEQPFRKGRLANAKIVLSAVAAAFVVTTGAGLFLHAKAGVIRDVPELGIRKGVNVERGMHARYNHRIHGHDLDFSGNDKIRVLVIGNSFARDWANVLLESRFGEVLEISYVEDPFAYPGFRGRADSAEVIFYSMPESGAVTRLALDTNRLWVVGTKSFGTSSGIFYNRKGDDYFLQRAVVDSLHLRHNVAWKREWGERFIDYFADLLDSQGTVPVFTPDSLFISQDCQHLTRGGARFFADRFEARLDRVFTGLREAKPPIKDVMR